MKLKIFIVFIVGIILSTGIYAAAQTVDPTVSEDGFMGRFSQQNVRFTDEEHELILNKRIELTFLYLGNYDQLTSVEKQNAFEQYSNALNSYVLELTGREYTGMRMFSRLTDDTREEFISHYVALTVKYFSNYDEMTDSEKETALSQFQASQREFMQTLKSSTGCNSFGQRQGRRQMGRR